MVDDHAVPVRAQGDVQFGDEAADGAGALAAVGVLFALSWPCFATLACPGRSGTVLRGLIGFVMNLRLHSLGSRRLPGF